MKDLLFNLCSFPNQARQPEEHPTRDSFPAFLADFARQMAHFNTGPRDHTSGSDLSERGPPLKEAECAYCHSKEGTLKRCLGCKRIVYCSKTCQKNHWREHKPDCQSISQIIKLTSCIPLRFLFKAQNYHHQSRKLPKLIKNR